jgi:hypothetical protein
LHENLLGSEDLFKAWVRKGSGIGKRAKLVGKPRRRVSSESISICPEYRFLDFLPKHNLQGLVASFYAKLDKIETEVSPYHQNDLFSQLVKELEECIHFIEMKKDAIFRLEKEANNQEDFFHRISYFYSFLVQVYYYTHNYEKIPSVVKKFFFDELKGEHEMIETLKSCFSYNLMFHGQLAFLKQGKMTVEECLSSLNNWTSKVVAHIDEAVYTTTQGMMENTVTLLMLMKEFDKAIAVGKQLEQLTGDKLTLATAYLEQYRLGLSDHTLLYKFMPSPLDGDYTDKDGFKSHARYFQDFLVYAQWDFIFTKVEAIHAQWDFIFTKVASRGAILWVDRFVQAICEDHKCGSCSQAVTDSDVPFVCSGCRVACYCSLDHQRMNWKKDPLRGTRIGHKLLCPMLNVCRKSRQAKDVGNKEAVKKWRRRLYKEILYFLSHGLGLEERFKMLSEGGIQKYN